VALAIDASSPAKVEQPDGTNAVITTASFTPPAGSLLLIRWSCDDSGGFPSAPSITDNLGVHLTYTRSDWQSLNDPATAHGQAAAWTAPVASSAAMTVSVTSGAGSGGRIAAMQVTVITGADTVTPVGAHGKSGSTSASSIAQSYTAQATNGWGFIAVADYAAVGTPSAGTGCSSDSAGNITSDLCYGFMRRTTADDTNGGSNTLNVTLPGTSVALNWVYLEIMPAATATSIPWSPQRTAQWRDPGETFWIQRDRRDANTVATAANDLGVPLLAPEHQRSVYALSSLLSRRPTTPQQPKRQAFTPGLLDSAELENELLGSADTARHYLRAATHAARWWMPQQKDPRNALLVATAANDLDVPLLAQADASQWHRYNDSALQSRRVQPQQRAYISEPSALATPPTDPLTVAGGVGGDLWRRYNTAVTNDDRRLMPQQREYEADPNLLNTALLENELLGGAETFKRYIVAASHDDRRSVPQQRVYTDVTLLATALLESPLMLPPRQVWWRGSAPLPQVARAGQQSADTFDPTVSGGEVWRRGQAATHVRRWSVGQQVKVVDLSPAIVPIDADPLLVVAGAGGSLWHRYNPWRRLGPNPRPIVVGFIGPPASGTGSPYTSSMSVVVFVAQTSPGARTGTTATGAHESQTGAVLFIAQTDGGMP
jgi:hypothetical protein